MGLQIFNPTTFSVSGLKSAFLDSNWSQKQNTSLNENYSTDWKPPDMDVEGDEMFSPCPTRYLPDFQKPFDEVVYPKGDPDAVSLSKGDVDLLQPNTYINDTIIDFYIIYLKNKMQEKEKARFHFFNSFFFRKLAGMDKNPTSACDGKSAFLRVCKWTRKVDLFEKDYIFIPVNFNLHWSLIVICHPGKVVNANINDMETGRIPCILHMDSIKGYHSGLKDLVQSYLCEEWKERNKDTCPEDLSSKFLNMHFLPAAVPQQENSFDCGLFLLHYLELFLTEAPFNFNPLRLSKFSNFLNLDWFPPAEPYHKRPLIQRLIFELVENNGSHEDFSCDNGDDYHSSEYNDNAIGGQCHLINEESSTYHAEEGIKMTPSFDSSCMVLEEHCEPGATLVTSLGHCHSVGPQTSNHCFNGSIFTMEDDTDHSKHLMSVTTAPNFQQVTRILPQLCSLPCSPEVCGKDISHRTETSLQAEHVKAESSPDTSSCASDDSEDVEIIEFMPVKRDSRSGLEDEHGERNCISIENRCHLPDLNDSVATTNPDVEDSDDIAIIENFPVKKESRSCLGDGHEEKDCMSIKNLHHLLDMNASPATINLPDMIDLDEMKPIVNESMSLLEDGREEKNCISTENLQHLTDMNASAATINFPCMNDSKEMLATFNESRSWLEDGCEVKPCIVTENIQHVTDTNASAATINLNVDPFNDLYQHLDMMSTGNNNWYQDFPNQVSDAADNKVIDDDVQIIENMNPDFWEERAAKRRRVSK